MPYTFGPCIASNDFSISIKWDKCQKDQDASLQKSISHRQDFENNAGRESESWQGANNVNTETLSQFLLLYKDALNLSEPQVSILEQENAEIEFLDYDWALNGTQ